MISCGETGLTATGSTVSLRVKQRRKKCKPFSINSAPRSPRGEQTQMKLLLTGVAELRRMVRLLQQEARAVHGAIATVD